ncbi:MAG TPA: hypothetical protein DGG95_04555 [Cytophagales bacterium]|nr:hypothetical protein [Cytophagales bacterium]
MNAYVLTKGPFAEWYNYAIVIVLVPIGLFVVYKIFIQYRILRLGNNEVRIDFPVLRKQRKYPLNEIQAWKENKVKTGKKSEFKEILVLFADKSKITIGFSEHTEYPKVIQYLTQKVPKKRVT